MDKRELIAKLIEIDEDAFFSYGVDPMVKPEVVIVGGSALLLCDFSPRAKTKDVDVLRASSNDAVRNALLSNPDFNTQCNAFIQNIPYNFEDRLKSIDLNTRMINYLVPSQEDIAVMKLYRWERIDIEDLMEASFLKSLNWDFLEYLVTSPDEAQGSRSALPEYDRELKQMRHNFSEYKRMCGK